MQLPSAPRTVLVTGAYGLIGNLVYAHLAAQPDRYTAYGMVRRNEASARREPLVLHVIPDERLHYADLTDFAAVQRAVEGMDTVVHMAADPDGRAGWESVLNSNIIGNYHLFEACRLAGVRRVVFASTNQVVFGYRIDEPYRSLLDGQFTPIQHTQPTRPLNYYACSKVFGEALAHMYAFTHAMSCLCLRIGWVTANDRPANAQAGPIWCSQRDIVQIVERCVNAPASLRFDIFFGHSDNHPNLVDLQHAREVLGYAPQD